VVLDFRKVSRGELLAGAAGIALIVFMLAVHWYGVRETNLVSGPTAPHGIAEAYPRDAFESFTFIDIYLLITALAAIALPLLRASELTISASLNLIVGGLGIAGVVVIVIKLIDPPDLVLIHAGVPHYTVSQLGGAEVIRKVGPWLGLVAAAGITVGALTSRRA
jgi:hypothetical protein